MLFRFIVSSLYSCPTLISPTAGTEEDSQVWDFEVDAGRDIEATYDLALNYGRGRAFVAGWHAGGTVSELFVRVHSSDANVSRRTTDWKRAFDRRK